MMQERMCVAPLVGARVEIMDAENALSVSYEVAPLVGARVEMLRVPTSRNKDTVAPLVGARVEILYLYVCETKERCRSPRGSAG